MNSKIVMSTMSIASALALMTGTTFAAWSSTVSNTNNTFGSGTLGFEINGQKPTSTGVFSVSGAIPGVSSTQVFDFSNSGSIIASSTALTGITVTPTSTPNLGDKLLLELWNDVDSSGTVTPGDIQIGVTKPLTDASWTNLPLGFGIPASGHHKVLAKITFDPAAGNEYQGKNISFDFSFIANQ